MTILATLKNRPDTGIRTSTVIRAEINALPHLARHAELLAAIEVAKGAAARVTDVEKQEAERQIADAVAAENVYRGKHARDFYRADNLNAELVAVTQVEHEAMIAARMAHHAGPESAECARLAALATAAAQEAFAQRIATHLLATSWRVPTNWTFGFPPEAIEARAKAILAELLA